MNPLTYAVSAPPHVRAGRFVADESRLSWVWRLLSRLTGSEAYLVGGTTRDALKGRVPQEIHLVIRNVPESKLDDYLRKEGRVRPGPAASFTFSPHDSDVWMDVSLPRTAFWNTSSRERRVVPNAYLPLSHDLAWRDFTSNAMAYSFHQGLLIDPFGGAGDLENGTLRSVGDPAQRFLEQPLRTLRALRFAAEHRLQIDTATWQALQRALPALNRVVTQEDGSAAFAVPRSDIGYELLRGLTAHVPYLLTLWEQSGAAKLLLPELSVLNQIEDSEGRTARARAEELLQELHQRGVTNPNVLLLALVYFLEDAAQPTAQSIVERLQLPLAEHEDFNHHDLAWFFEQRHVAHREEPDDMRPSDFAKIFGGERGHDLLHLLESVAHVGGTHDEARSRLHRARRRQHKLLRDVAPPTLLKGRDVVALGVAPGPHVRSILKTVQDAQLEGQISTKEEALNLARQAMKDLS